jgi:aromatic ring-opening dioxygenase LigB subunit
VLVAAAILPHPPLLVPQVGTGDDDAIAELRTRCSVTVERLRAVDTDRLYVVGADIGPHTTSFLPWGSDVAVDVPEPLPLPLLVGAWLTAGTTRSFVAVGPDLDAVECGQLGADLAGSAPRVSLLVMGDGAARHTEKAPGYLDPRAAGWDAAVHDAFRAGDPAALAGLDVALAADLLVAGRAPWQILAGAVGDATVTTGDAHFSAPYGVGYHVVSWLFVPGDGVPQ